MAFSVINSSPLRNLVELNCRVAEANDPDSADLHVTLMVQPDEVDIGEYDVVVKIRSLLLCVEVHGCDTDPTTKYGARHHKAVETKRAKVDRSVKATISKSQAIEAVAKGQFDGIKGALEASLKTTANASEQQEVVLSESEEMEHHHFIVEAIGGDRWRVQHSDEKPLKGHYVADDRLCRLIKRPWPANRFAATISAQVKRRDIEAEVVKNKKFLGWTSPNRDKIIGLLLSKELSEQPHDQSGNAITFASSEFNDA